MYYYTKKCIKFVLQYYKYNYYIGSNNKLGHRIFGNPNLIDSFDAA